MRRRAVLLPKGDILLKGKLFSVLGAARYICVHA